MDAEAKAEKYLSCTDSEFAWKKVCQALATADPEKFNAMFESVFTEGKGVISAAGMLHVAEVYKTKQKVDAIKMYRGITGSSLTEAKLEVDAMGELLFFN